jgi:hypothetical protein
MATPKLPPPASPTFATVPKGSWQRGGGGGNSVPLNPLVPPPTRTADLTDLARKVTAEQNAHDAAAQRAVEGMGRKS